MKIYHDQDADLSLLEDQTIAVIGYGNQGRAQALNLRDSGLCVIVGNREDEYAERAQDDGFDVLAIADAAAAGDVLLLLVPDEVMPTLFEGQIASQLTTGDSLVFASGYSIAFDLVHPPMDVDVILVAPRMIGAGVRDLYTAGHGFPSFVGVAQDHTGHALALALALAKGIGSTRTGVVEVTFEEEAELDLFTEQCFGPAFGRVLTTAVDLLLEEGYPPEAVLMELYMSGEFAYTLAKIAEMGLIEQSELHSRTSQYGSMSRGMRFQLPGLRERMLQGLEEIRSGQFAQEWAAEQAEGCPTLEMLKESARALSLGKLEHEVRQALHDVPSPPVVQSRAGTAAVGRAPRSQKRGVMQQALAAMRGLIGRGQRGASAMEPLPALREGQLEKVLHHFLEQARRDPALEAFAEGRHITTHYTMLGMGLEFYLGFQEGKVTGGLGHPPDPADVRLSMDGETLDAMFTERINPARAAMSGRISFDGDARRAMTVQRVQTDLVRLYGEARARVTGERE